MKTNWIEIFKALNEREPQKYGCRISPDTDETEMETLNDYTESLTIEQLKAFKRETKGLTPPEIIAFIDGMNIQPPKPMFAKTPNPVLNKAHYRMQRNFVQFIKDYRQSLISTQKPARGLPFDYTDQQIDTLLAELRKGFIPQGTRWEDLKAVFTGETVPFDFTPVVWPGILTKLAYFLNIENANTGTPIWEIWKTAARLFVDEERNHFTPEKLKKAFHQGKGGYPDIIKITNEIREKK